MMVAAITVRTTTSNTLLRTCNNPASPLGSAIRSTAPTPSEAPMTSAPKPPGGLADHGDDQAADHADHDDQQRPDPQ